MSSDNAISVKNLKKIFLDEVAVDDVSFEVPYGQITALLGSNGAGKSTTLNIIAGIMTPTAGDVKIAGMSFDNDYKKIKSSMGYLTCDMELYRTLSVLECLRLVGDLKGDSRPQREKRVEELQEEFGLHDFIDKHYEELSSGQKQRSLIAVSVFHDPDILIFDEVTASLDLIVSKGIMDFLIKEKERGKAVLFSTHILSEVEYLSDRILMLEQGKLVKETTNPELIESTGAKNLTEAFYHALVDVKRVA